MRIAVIGEGMLELSRDPAAQDRWRLGYGGDTLNTAIHLARLGFDVTFITALGPDRFSDKLRSDWRAEGLNVDHVLTDPRRLPGLYAIDTAADGERSFSYWRSDSAARALFALPGIEEALSAAARADLLYFSLITLAVLPDVARTRLYQLGVSVRANGGRVAFDSNFRPQLWASLESARTAAALAGTVADIALPTLTDEQAMQHGEDPRTIADHWHRFGVPEVVVKLGAEGAFVSILEGDRLRIPAREGLGIVDTSGAGDAFNAGYLGVRLLGGPPERAAQTGAELAAWVIQQPGAIPSPGEAEPYCKSTRAASV
jgi:2-dehydro-3-deoxygluconokinase